MGFIKRQSIEPVTVDERKQSRDCESLIAQLAHADPSVRRWAARDLVACPDASASLIECLKQETDATVRGAVFTTLTRLHCDVAIAGLVDCLRNDDPALRNEAIEAMQELPEEVGEIMDGLLQDADSDVRIFAVNILESLRHPKVETWLVGVIECDPHVNVCAAAVDLLGEVGSTLARDPLQRIKARFPDEPYISFAADLALKRINEA